MVVFSIKVGVSLSFAIYHLIKKYMNKSNYVKILIITDTYLLVKCMLQLYSLYNRIFTQFLIIKIILKFIWV